jgi:NAD(P)-dependent dehydrogenase (short-subunit alcohol dehydrogenase family)
MLTKLLLDKIPQPEGRIINVSSAAQSPVNLRALRGEQSVAGGDFSAYAQSKLALMAWSRHWALQLQHSDGGGGGGPLMISVNPGSLLGTKMVKEGFGTNGRDINIGANVLVSLALDTKHITHAGEYYDNDERQGYGPPHKDVLNPKICQTIVETIETLLP